MPSDTSEPDPRDEPPRGGSSRHEQPGAGGSPKPAELSTDERGELDELRHRLTALEASTPPPRPRHHRLRTSGSVVLIVISSLLALIAVIAVWTNSIVGDTDRYVATVAPLASNPDVQAALTNRVTSEVLAQIDVKAVVNELSQAAVQQGAPPELGKLIGGLTGPITSGLTQLVSSTVNKVVTSNQFETLWVDANRAVHSSLDKALTGKGGGAVSLENNQVAIDIGPFVAKVKDQLVASGFGPAAKIPEVHTNFVVFASKDVGKVKSYFRLLQIMGAWLPVIAVLVAAAGVFTAVNRRRALVGAALGVAIAMLLLGVVLTVFRSFYLDHLPPGASQAAAGAIYDALIRFLRASIRAVGVTALVTAAGAFLIGPSKVAVAIRTACSSTIGALREVSAAHGLHLGPVGRFVHRFKRWIGAAILAVAAVVLATWSYPTAAVVLWIVVVVLVGFAVREFLDAKPGDSTPPRSDPTVGSAPRAGT
ncbi:hypothetical protein OG689_38025 [Kitasatospora sp. NBC_00240]|uniref:hypothetical protein n=1 Tax=Kitasatospora sp. NBC_00240 TaxID=2903567 RepID=UPI00224F7AD4|nr:hypothetical protein [Kitasatospora sp. NBC_00240]MCX5214996.1 hypothetical protein [Kitasatospora sp. NBC_00240]